MQIAAKQKISVKEGIVDRTLENDSSLSDSEWDGRHVRGWIDP